MAENRDNAIKLFGKTIPLHPKGSGKGGGAEEEKSQDLRKEEATPISKHQVLESPDSQEHTEPTTSSSEIHKPCSSSDQDDALTTKNSALESEQPGNYSKERTGKKPDDILPCPRCKSLDTKFGYYNNYNVNQPRHFCKHCQRYWTAGGAMRNVPVGAGRRKNKNAAHHSSLRVLRSDAYEPVIHRPPSSPTSGTVLCFSSNAKNGFHPVTAPPLPPSTNNGDEQSPDMASKSPFCASSILIPFSPAAAYWSCTLPPAITWSIPWLSPEASSSPNGCPTLGKHSRDGNTPKDTILVPKTLRIDDPEEAARSSIWTMVGTRSDKSSNAVCGGDLLKEAFQAKIDVKNHALESRLLVHANPAALSRSMNFQETS